MERENPLARAFCVLLAALTVVLWATIARRDFNILVSAVLAVCLLSFTLNKLDHGAWTGFQRVVVKNRLAGTAFGGAIVSAFFVTAMLNGDWDVYRMASTCLFIGAGVLHIHHWAKALAVVAWHGDIFDISHLDDDDAKARLAKKYSRRTLVLGSGLIAAGGIVAAITPKNISLWLDLGLHGIYFLMLGAVCQGNINAKWAKVYLALSLGIAVGVQLHGDIRSLPDFWSKSVPSSLIFWHTGTDPLCPVL